MGIPILSSIAEFASGLVGNAIKPILDKFIGDKMSDSEKALLVMEAEKAARNALLQEQDQFNQFVIEHTGAAKDMPRFIQILRGSVRPVITYAAFGVFAWFSWWVFNNIVTITNPDQLVIIHEVQSTTKGVLFIVLVFWFGDRLLTRTGVGQVIGQMILGRKTNGEQSS